MKYTVGLFSYMRDKSRRRDHFQMWNVQEGQVKNDKLIWHTVVEADNEQEAINKAQKKYMSEIEKAA